MDASTNRSVALLSIRPEYVERILNGTKRVEFRKTRISSDLKYVVVYCTSPIKRIVAFFKVAAVVEGVPGSIWSQYRKVAGVSHAFYRDYFENSHHAVAIEVDQVFPLASPMRLHDLDDMLSPPQSFQYVPESYIAQLWHCTARSERLHG
jgi:predicted transcriptional regulator